MKSGFTLLELIIVTIIVGVLATLGFNQYTKVIEKSRGAEAKGICGDIRKLAAAYYLANGGNLTGVANVDLGIGSGIPSACASTHYFSYGQTNAASGITITATRCTASGKNPQGSAATTLILTSNLTNGSDVWSGTGGY